MIDLIDKVIVYLTFGSVCALSSYILFTLHRLKNSNKINMDFNGKVVMSLQEVNTAITETQNSVKMLMSSFGVSTDNASDKKEVKGKSPLKKTESMDYAG